MVSDIPANRGRDIYHAAMSQGPEARSLFLRGVVAGLRLTADVVEARTVVKEQQTEGGVLETIRDLEAMSKRLMTMAASSERRIGCVLRNHSTDLDGTSRALSAAAAAVGDASDAKRIAREFGDIQNEQEC